MEQAPIPMGNRNDRRRYRSFSRLDILWFHHGRSVQRSAALRSNNALAECKTVWRPHSKNAFEMDGLVHLHTLAREPDYWSALQYHHRRVPSGDNRPRSRRLERILAL